MNWNGCVEINLSERIPLSKQCRAFPIFNFSCNIARRTARLQSQVLYEALPVGHSSLLRMKALALYRGDGDVDTYEVVWQIVDKLRGRIRNRPRIRSTGFLSMGQRSQVRMQSLFIVNEFDRTARVYRRVAPAWCYSTAAAR